MLVWRQERDASDNSAPRQEKEDQDHQEQQEHEVEEQLGEPQVVHLPIPTRSHRLLLL